MIPLFTTSQPATRRQNQHTIQPARAGALFNNASVILYKPDRPTCSQAVMRWLRRSRDHKRDQGPTSTQLEDILLEPSYFQSLKTSLNRSLTSLPGLPRSFSFDQRSGNSFTSLLMQEPHVSSTSRPIRGNPLSQIHPTSNHPQKSNSALPHHRDDTLKKRLPAATIATRRVTPDSRTRDSSGIAATCRSDIRSLAHGILGSRRTMRCMICSGIVSGFRSDGEVKV